MLSAIKVLIAVGLLVISVAGARIPRDAPNPTEKDAITKISDEVSQHLKQIEGTFLKAFGFENAEEFRAKAADQGKELTTNLEGWVQKIKQQTEELKDNEAVKELRAYVDSTIGDISAKLPKTTDEVKKFAENLQGESEQVVTKIKELGETEEAKNVKDLSQKLLDSALVALKGLANEIQANVKQTAAQ